MSVAPRCLGCFRKMKLVQVNSASKDTEVRTYHCWKCDQTKQVASPKDPLASDAVRWLAGELRPPD